MKNIFFIIVFSFCINILFGFEQSGVASWYGPKFHGKKTANGEIFNTYDYTCAHRTLPFGSIIKVVSLENSNEVYVRVNDRGPFAKDRIIDLSKVAAAKIGALSNGTMKVKLVLMESGDNIYVKNGLNAKDKMLLKQYQDNEIAADEKKVDKKVEKIYKSDKVNFDLYDVMIVSLSNEEKAHIVKNQMIEKGFECVVKEKVTRNKVYYRVLIEDVVKNDIVDIKTALNESGFGQYLIIKKDNYL